jgi:16S rRNA (uracil1498-N3)-methyltransferase
MANRYFVDMLPNEGRASLPEDVAHHLAVVLRARPGDRLVLADGRGNRCEATVAAASKRELVVEVGPHLHAPAPTQRLHLAFAPPKLQRAEWLFEHGTELGVAAFWPLWTARTRPQGERLERWLKIAAAAAGQSDRDWLPTIHPPRELAEFLTAAELPARRFVGDGGGTGFHAADATPGEAVVLVGPEGGFAPDEAAAVAAAGFVPRRFGPHILRTETAGLVGAALWLHAAGGGS